MRYLFLPGADLSGPNIIIDGPPAHHLLNVLRIRVGEPLVLLDNAGAASRCEAVELGKRAVSVRITGLAACPPEPCIDITVAQAIGKGDKLEQVIQHATEIGASAFIPVTTERTIVKLGKLTLVEAEKKRERWSLIAQGAAEQAGRGRIPRIGPVMDLPSLVGRFHEFRTVRLLHPPGLSSDSTAMPSVSSTRGVAGPVLLIVGPEGGFAPAEIASTISAGAVLTSLGPYTLRTETAALVAVTQILWEANRG